MHSRTGMREQRIHYKQLEPKKFKVCFCYPKRFLIKNYIPKGTIRIFFLKKETNTRKICCYNKDVSTQNKILKADL